ncbi:hypothetical protein AB0K74_30355 [Streptomyces sp. NPDC056159]|uniref:hypothetical protein n=1 Tax=unclassified Streptomyces TaxID=2593676 RepID=UPI003423E23A
MVNLYACLKCGAVVHDRARHKVMHDELEDNIDFDEAMQERDPRDFPSDWMPLIQG